MNKKQFLWIVCLVLISIFNFQVLFADFESELFDAVKNDKLLKVKLFVKSGADVNSKDDDGRTPLLYAAYKGNFKIAEHLIENGADVNAEDKYHLTPIITASAQGHRDMVELLINKGAVINAEDILGYTPLITAAKKNKIEVVKLLIEKGADIDTQDKKGNTALIWMADEGYTDIALLLKEKGADIYVRNEDGETALQVAQNSKQTEIIKILKADSRTEAFIRAAGEGNLNEVDGLLRSGINVNARNDDGITALMVAAAQGNTEIVELLIAKGADVNIQTSKGSTALSFAEFGGHTDIIKLLKGDPITEIIEKGNYAVVDSKPLSYLHEYGLSELEKSQLRILRNTFYAKYGYQFKSKDLRDHFSRFSWYTPKYSNVDEYLTFEDRYIIENLLRLEGTKGINVLKQQDLETILCGFWVESYPLQPGFGGYKFYRNKNFDYLGNYGNVITTGTWKIEGSAIYVKSKGKNEWQKIGDFQNYNFFQRFQDGPFYESMKLPANEYYKIQGLYDWIRMQANDIYGYWTSYFPVPAGCDGYMFLEDYTFIYDACEVVPSGNIGTVGKWKIEGDKLYIYSEYDIGRDEQDKWSAKKAEVADWSLMGSIKRHEAILTDQSDLVFPEYIILCKNRFFQINELNKLKQGYMKERIELYKNVTGY